MLYGIAPKPSVATDPREEKKEDESETISVNGSTATSFKPHANGTTLRQR